jgi:regulator of sigma E protease
MLPIPVLDGGHIVLAIIESIRRKPVNIRILEFVQTGCAVLIIGYMAYVSFFDIGDLFGRDSDDDKPPRAAASATPAP